MKAIKAIDAIGKALAWDVTRIDPQKKIKGPAFRRGHIIRQEDVDVLLDLGNELVYILDGESTDVHEDDVAGMMAPLIAGDHIYFDPAPTEGKIGFYAGMDGLFKVDTGRLLRLNSMSIPSMPTIHNNFPVKKDRQVAAFRIIPLACPEEMVFEMRRLLEKPLLRIAPYRIQNASILVTGNEIYKGRIKDGFLPLLRPKLAPFGVDVVFETILPDSVDAITDALRKSLEISDLVLLTGGTSVDPGDVTAEALRRAGLDIACKGNPIQPGNHFSIAYQDAKPVCAVPAGALFFKTTALDIFLPRLLAGERLGPEDIARYGHGGLCHFCKSCSYPVCAFGKGV